MISWAREMTREIRWRKGHTDTDVVDDDDDDGGLTRCLAPGVDGRRTGERERGSECVRARRTLANE